MFKINQNKIAFLELKNTAETSKASICLDQGGRLQSLTFNTLEIIKELPSFEYKNSYASSILFPFANRIEAGKYTFQEKEQQLPCNESSKNALHGLVYNKKFELIEKQENSNYCSVTICYKETKKAKASHIYTKFT